MGDPMKEGIKLGPLALSRARKNLHRQVLDAVKAGARILTGGEIPAGPGNFYPPTVLVGLPPEAAIAKEEFFGPVAMIFPFKTEEEAIHLANITDFGLSAAVWSRDLVSARRVAGPIRRLQGFRVWARTWRSWRTGTYQPKTDLAGCLNNSTRRIPTDTLGIDWTRPISSAREK